MVVKECLETKITESCDVLVCGGGFAGISAALAAARQGKQVILLEKQFILGGLATAGLVTIYLPLCDGYGRQVSFGIAEELFRLSVSMGAEKDYPANWLDGIGTRTVEDQRFQVQFNPSLFAILAEKLLLEAGVQILYGTYAVAVSKENDRICAVIVENKSGRSGIGVKTVVDATGDCDIAAFAHAPTENFRQGNIVAAWYYGLDEQGYDLHMLGFCDIPEEEKKERKGPELLHDQRFGGLDGKELSQMVQLSHSSTLRDILQKRVNHPTLVPTSVATIPQIRMTRRVVGEYTMVSGDDRKYMADSVGMVSDWRKRGPVYEVPFGSLYSAKVKNLICAGRCTSTEESMWDLMRVIPCCAVTGQAAGTAAALCEDMTALDVAKLQKVLQNNGVVLHQRELPKKETEV